MKLAACIGNRFSLQNLSKVSSKSKNEVVTDLWIALQKGLIIPSDKNYKLSLLPKDGIYISSFENDVSYQFIHDRIQQASYSLIPVSERNKLHLKIGEMLLNGTSEFSLIDNIFDIVNQMNIAISLLESQEEKNNLASLNITAGKKSKTSCSL